jgi:hypothetical protein
MVRTTPSLGPSRDPSIESLENLPISFCSTGQLMGNVELGGEATFPPALDRSDLAHSQKRLMLMDGSETLGGSQKRLMVRQSTPQDLMELQQQRQARRWCTTMHAAAEEWREEWRSGTSADPHPLWRIPTRPICDVSGMPTFRRRTLRYLAAVAMHGCPMLVFLLIFAAIGPTYESARAFVVSKSFALSLGLGSTLVWTNFSFRNLLWLYIPSAASFVAIWALDAYVSFMMTVPQHGPPT